MTAKEKYTAAYRALRTTGQAAYDFPYSAYAQRSLNAKRLSSWANLAYDNIWSLVHGKNRYATGLVWALAAYEPTFKSSGPSDVKYICDVRGITYRGDRQ